MPFDINWEAEGIILEEEYFCFNCKKKMIKSRDNKYSCPKCKIVYDEEENP